MTQRLEEKNQKILRALLQLPDNKRCADCIAKGPVYANTTFHTFVCTTCSGIHREHSWRVKSVSMSSFTPEEIKALQAGGNKHARDLYMAKWKPEEYPEPEAGDVEKIREWVTKKYVDKKWFDASKADSEAPKAEPLSNILGNNIPPIKVEAAKKPAAPAAPAAAPAPAKSDSFNFGDFSFDAPTPTPTPAAQPPKSSTALFGSIAIPDHVVHAHAPAAAAPAAGGFPDFFDTPSPAPSPAPAPAPAAPSLTTSTPATKSLDLNSLYGQQSAQAQQQQFFQQPQQPQSQFFGQPGQQFPNAGFPGAQGFPPQQQQQHFPPVQQQQFGQPQPQFGQPFGQQPHQQPFAQPGGFPAQGNFGQAPPAHHQQPPQPFGQQQQQFGGFPAQQQPFPGAGPNQPYQQQPQFAQPYQGSPSGFPGAAQPHTGFPGAQPAQASPNGFPGAAHPPPQQFGQPHGFPVSQGNPFYPGAPQPQHAEPAKPDLFAGLSVPFQQMKVSAPAKPAGPPLGSQPKAASATGGDLFSFDSAPSSSAHPAPAHPAPVQSNQPASGNLLDFF
eukprot:TRINITY_DN4480_c0_g1_i1.p1 TRINITY_DN4480_c0_g1~~TRINITY_DN4480_c0_g1_i1.p1  ORF type:complete len:554 (+),score=172.17 TRINITY_DN4480_c0_g1_i1:1702-3363(+)